MGHSRAEKAQSRERILAAAAVRVREAGLESLSVGEIMKSVNLTHGGFYGHFGSRSALVAAAIERALADGEVNSARHTRTGDQVTVKSIVNSYLSPTHRDHPGTGCAIPLLAAEAGRASPEVRAIMAAQLTKSFAAMEEAVEGSTDAEQVAVSAWAMMIGAMLMSRVFDGDPRSDQILSLVRKSILELEHLHSAPSSD